MTELVYSFLRRIPINQPLIKLMKNHKHQTIMTTRSDQCTEK